LVVLQTMSKSFGLAGIRLGIAYASPTVISYMMKVKAPYNINKLTAQKASEAFEYLDTLRAHISALKKERKRLRQMLQTIPIVHQFYTSVAIFFLVKMAVAAAVYKQVSERAIILRFPGNEPLCTDCLRITVGLPEENDELISALKN